MKTSIYFILGTLILSGILSCTPQTIAAENGDWETNIYNTGDDQAVYPDNERD